MTQVVIKREAGSLLVILEAKNCEKGGQQLKSWITQAADSHAFLLALSMAVILALCSLVVDSFRE